MMSKKNLSILLLTMGSGGAERVVSNLLPSLHEKYNVTLVLFYDVFHFEVPDYIDVEVVIQKIDLSPLDKITVFFKVLKRYNQILSDRNIDISLSFLTRPNLVNAFSRSGSIRKIISERCYPSIAYRSSYFRFLLYRLLLPIGYNKVDHLFSNSQYINDDLRKKFGLKIPSTVIYNPVRLEKPKVYTSGDSLKLITIGSMTSIKNHELILKSMVGQSNVSLTMVGDGILRVKLESMVQSLGLNNKVTMTGKIKDVTREISSRDLFLLSSNSEGFPNALLEAMANGLSVISTNCKSGPLELLNDGEPVDIELGSFYKAKYGVLINVGDPLGMYSAIQYFNLNREQLVYYGAIAYRRAGDFSIPLISEQLINRLEVG